MEFHVRAPGRLPVLSRIEEALLAQDPAAVVDIDPLQGLRVSTTIDAGRLAELLNAAGGQVQAPEVEARPSVCCGGCSG